RRVWPADVLSEVRAPALPAVPGAGPGGRGTGGDARGPGPGGGAQRAARCGDRTAGFRRLPMLLLPSLPGQLASRGRTAKHMTGGQDGPARRRAARTSDTAGARRNAHLTYQGNHGRHAWLRLTPAYSVRLVRDYVATLGPGSVVTDPFSGTGTT